MNEIPDNCSASFADALRGDSWSPDGTASSRCFSAGDVVVHRVDHCSTSNCFAPPNDETGTVALMVAVLLVAHGQMQITPADPSASVIHASSGEAAYVALCQPFVLTIAPGTRWIVIELPEAALRSGGIAIRSGADALRAPATFCACWGFFDALANGETREVSADHLLMQLTADMVCAVFAEAYRILPACDSGDEGLFMMACSFIAQFAHDSTLDVSTVATTLGVPTRHLQSIFRAHNTSFAAELRATRSQGDWHGLVSRTR